MDNDYAFRKPTQRHDNLYSAPKEQYLGDRYDHERHIRQQHVEPRCAATPADGACIARPPAQLRRAQMYDREEGTRERVYAREVDARQTRKTSEEYVYARDTRRARRGMSSSSSHAAAFANGSVEDSTVVADVTEVDMARARAVAKRSIIYEKEEAPLVHPSTQPHVRGQRRLAMNGRDPRPRDRFDQLSETQAARADAEAKMKKTNFGSDLYKDDPDVTVNRGIFVGKKDVPWTS